MTESKTVEALGFKWVLEPNSEWADMYRKELANNAVIYLANTFKRPADYNMARSFLDYYPEIISSAVSVTKTVTVKGDDGNEVENQVEAVDEVAPISAWLELAKASYAVKRYADLNALFNAASELNPQWVVKDPTEDAPADVQAAKETVEASLPGEGTDISAKPLPDSDELLEQASKVTNFVDEKAKKEGGIGPTQFRKSGKKQ